MRKIEERYYFAYGSNMNLGQMRFRCPDAEVVGNVRLEDYRLAFRGRAPGNGVATVLPEKGSYVDALSDFLIMILSWLVKQSLRAFLFQEVQP